MLCHRLNLQQINIKIDEKVKTRKMFLPVETVLRRLFDDIRGSEDFILDVFVSAKPVSVN